MRLCTRATEREGAHTRAEGLVHHSVSAQLNLHVVQPNVVTAPERDVQIALTQRNIVIVRRNAPGDLKPAVDQGKLTRVAANTPGQASVKK